ncbi:MAG TPA: thioesterase family protein [Pyrinomonadaceae bacterium]
MSFSTQLTINFGDTDPAALVYFPNIFHYCHIVMERFFHERCGVPYSTLIHEKRLGFPTVQVQAEFKSAIRYGDLIGVELTVAKVGTKSLSLSYKLTREDVVCAEVSQVVVAMDLDSHRSVEIPDFLREVLRRE